jgi:regulator of protease activity HflC (stomatin/prohibitin superfamily)
MAKYTAEELIGDRSTLAKGIEDELGKALESRNIEIVATAIEDLDFTDTFTNAVEAKQVAAQNKLKAEIEQEQAVKQAEADARVAQTKANADAEVAKIQAQADREVAQIGADSAEYQGRKEAAIRLQALASVNGWTVVTNEETKINELYKANGEKVNAEELLIGTEKLIKYYEIMGWDGKLPVYYVADDGNVLPILSTCAN